MQQADQDAYLESKNVVESVATRGRHRRPALSNHTSTLFKCIADNASTSYWDNVDLAAINCIEDSSHPSVKNPVEHFIVLLEEGVGNIQGDKKWTQYLSRCLDVDISRSVFRPFGVIGNPHLPNRGPRIYIRGPRSSGAYQLPKDVKKTDVLIQYCNMEQPALSYDDEIPVCDMPYQVWVEGSDSPCLDFPFEIDAHILEDLRDVLQGTQEGQRLIRSYRQCIDNSVTPRQIYTNYLTRRAHIKSQYTERLGILLKQIDQRYVRELEAFPSTTGLKTRLTPGRRYGDLVHGTSFMHHRSNSHQLSGRRRQPPMETVLPSSSMPPSE